MGAPRTMLVVVVTGEVADGAEKRARVAEKRAVLALKQDVREAWGC